MALFAALILLSGAAMANDRTVTVSGRGEVLASPDSALVRLGVEARGRDQQDTQREVEKVVRAFMEACDDLDIERRHVKTAQLNIRPEYDWNNETRQRRLIGYYVHRALEVDLRELEKLGLLLDRATALGVNQASNPELRSSRKDELTREALSSAAENARLNAEALAATLDAKLGRVRKISTSDISYRPPPSPRMMAMEADVSRAGSGGADTYTAGEIRFNAEVIVEFDLSVD